MYLLKTIKREKSFPDSEEVDGLYSDRWEQLESYRCNPWTELNNTVANLYKPFPKPQGSKTKQKGFLPGTFSNTYHFGTSDYLNQILPGFELPGMLEEAGIPLRIGNTVMYPEQIANASNWLAPFSPLRSLFMIIKLGDDKKVKHLFDYEYIATLTEEDVTLIFQFLSNAFKFSIQNNLFNSQKVLEINLKKWIEQQIRILSEILSRIAFRLNGVDLASLLELAIQAYKLPLFKNDRQKIKQINTLFNNILYGAPDSLVLEQMSDLLKLPIPEANGFSICRDGKLDEPFLNLIWSESATIDDTFDRTSWSEPILNLIEIAKNGTAESRGRAAYRLYRLQQINGLTEEEENLFGEALWNRVDEKTQLPQDTIFYNHVYLELPKPEFLTEKEITERVRQFLLHHEIPPLTFAFLHNKSDKQPIEEILGASLSITKSNIKHRHKLIDWTSQEAEQLLKKIEQWWNSQATVIKSFLENDSKVISDDWQSYSFLLLKVFIEVIFPKIAKSDKAIKKSSLAIIDEFQELGFCVNHALPGLLFVDPDRYSYIYNQIQLGLFSSDKEEVELSIIGVYYWLLYANSNLLPTPPHELLDTWINLIAMRRIPGLDLAMNFISGLITKIPKFLTDNQKQILLIALKHLKRETKLPVWNEQQMTLEDNSMIPVERRSYSKIQASCLAHKLYKTYEDKQENIPSILIEWKQEGVQSIHPEIRRIWT